MERLAALLIVMISIIALLGGCATGPTQYTDAEGDFHSNGYEYEHTYWMPGELPEGGTFYEVELKLDKWSIVQSSEEPKKYREDSELVYVTEGNIQPYYGFIKPMFGQSEPRDRARVFICDTDTRHDRYNPCDSVLTKQHPMVWSGVSYVSEDGRSNFNNMTAGFYRLDDERLADLAATIRN